MEIRGGAYFNLKNVADEQVLAGFGEPPYSLVSAEEIDIRPSALQTLQDLGHPAAIAVDRKADGFGFKGFHGPYVPVGPHERQDVA